MTPAPNLAEYGIVIFVVGGLFALAKYAIDAYGGKKAPPVASGSCADKLTKVIENNTMAIMENTKSNQVLQTTIQVSLTKQEGMLDEILVRART